MSKQNKTTGFIVVKDGYSLYVKYIARDGFLNERVKKEADVVVLLPEQHSEHKAIVSAIADALRKST